MPRVPNVNDIAKVCHEVNRAICEANGDKSQLPWIEAADWQRESAIRNVEYALQNPGAMPADLHEQWCEDKRRDGWSYGSVKDAALKTHPCLVPYDQLPDFQKAKDYAFQAVVKSMREFVEVAECAGPVS